MKVFHFTIFLSFIFHFKLYSFDKNYLENEVFIYEPKALYGITIEEDENDTHDDSFNETDVIFDKEFNRKTSRKEIFSDYVFMRNKYKKEYENKYTKIKEIFSEYKKKKLKNRAIFFKKILFCVEKKIMEKKISKHILKLKFYLYGLNAGVVSKIPKDINEIKKHDDESVLKEFKKQNDYYNMFLKNIDSFELKVNLYYKFFFHKWRKYLQ